MRQQGTTSDCGAQVRGSQIYKLRAANSRVLSALCFTLRPHSISFLGLPYRILNMNHKKDRVMSRSYYNNPPPPPAEVVLRGGPLGAGFGLGSGW